MADMIKLGGLWTNKDKDGNTFLTGKLNPGVRILIFKNKYREAENHPTHIMYLAQVESEASRAQDDDLLGSPETDRPIPRPAARPRQAGPMPAAPPPLPEDYDDSDLDDPFADDAPAPAPAPRRHPHRPGTGREAGF